MQDRAGDLGRMLTLEWAHARGAAVGVHIVEEGSVGIRRQNGNDLDSGAVQFHPQRVTHCQEGEFARAVNAVARRDHDAQDAAHIDDLTRSLFTHVWQNRLKATEWRVEIQLHQVVRVVRWRCRNRRAHADAGVVDQDVHATELRDRGRDETAHVFVFRHIGGNDMEAIAQVGMRVCYLLQFCQGTRGENHAGAFPGEGQGGFQTDAAGGTGDDDDFILKTPVHFGPISLLGTIRLCYMADGWLGNAGAIFMDAHSSTTPKLVLVIDDEPEILDVVRQCLESEGFPVLTALGAKEGLKAYENREAEIGLVLLDFVMPDMTGDLVFECLRQKNQDVRVILLTACEDTVARTMFEAGLRGFIQKPFYIDDLVNRVREELALD